MLEQQTIIQKPKKYNLQECVSIIEVVTKILLLGIEIKPGCANCTDWFIKVDSDFWFKSNVCTCYHRVNNLKKIISMFNRANIRKEIVKNYELKIYQENILDKDMIYKYITEDTEKPRLYMYWWPWTGKTYSAFISLMFWLVLDNSILYTNVPKLMDDLRPSEQDIGKVRIDKCIDADILILDDFGQEKVSERVRERLYIIINERYITRKKTIFTSNLSIDELNLKLNHKPIISRISHLSIPLDYSGQDKRIIQDL